MSHTPWIPIPVRSRPHGLPARFGLVPILAIALMLPAGPTQARDPTDRLFLADGKVRVSADAMGQVSIV